MCLYFIEPKSSEAFGDEDDEGGGYLLSTPSTDAHAQSQQHNDTWSHRAMGSLLCDGVLGWGCPDNDLPCKVPLSRPLWSSPPEPDPKTQALEAFPGQPHQEFKLGGSWRSPAIWQLPLWDSTSWAVTTGLQQVTQGASLDYGSWRGPGSPLGLWKR